MADELRETETRETQKRNVWKPRAMLETPEPPEGYKYRWIRHELKGDDDTRNVVQSMQQGYEPVKAAEMPADFITQVTTDGAHAGAIINGDLMLCKIPVENVRERKAYYRDRTKKQQDAVDAQLMQGQSSQMPITQERRSGVTKGRPTDFEE